MTITVWFCTLCRDDVQVGAKPDKCPSCGPENLKPIQYPFVPEKDRADILYNQLRECFKPWTDDHGRFEFWIPDDPDLCGVESLDQLHTCSHNLRRMAEKMVEELDRDD